MELRRRRAVVPAADGDRPAARAGFICTLLAAALTASSCASIHTLRAFTTDGCSLFPDGDGESPDRWHDCCVSHDMSYWRGGSAAQRRHADAALGACVLAATGRPLLAEQMSRAVRLGGMPLLPTSFRWGYGWGYGRGYQVLTPQEQLQADERLAAYRRGHPGAPCR